MKIYIRKNGKPSPFFDIKENEVIALEDLISSEKAQKTASGYIMDRDAAQRIARYGKILSDIEFLEKKIKRKSPAAWHSYVISRSSLLCSPKIGTVLSDILQLAQLYS